LRLVEQHESYYLTSRQEYLFSGFAPVY